MQAGSLHSVLYCELPFMHIFPPQDRNCCHYVCMHNAKARKCVWAGEKKMKKLRNSPMSACTYPSASACSYRLWPACSALLWTVWSQYIFQASNEEFKKIQFFVWEKNRKEFRNRMKTNFKNEKKTERPRIIFTKLNFKNEQKLKHNA